MRDPGRGLVDPVRFNAALNDFQRARARASLQAIAARLRGQSTSLLSFDDVSRRLQVTGQGLRRQEAIPLDAIVGSVGRYNDFTRTFLPRTDSDAQRWARLKAASQTINLPPIDVYQIGDAYFVADGNHRVSIARQEGLTHIDAHITTLQTRVPLAPDDDPDTLIVKTEYADFLARTRLDVLRPAVDVRVSAPGQIGHLENLIEVFRYFLEEREQRGVDDEEAVARWVDEAYLPFVETMREQGILRYFPRRTEADLYVWVATHQAELRNQLGWTVSAQKAASSLMQSTVDAREGWLARARSWFKRLLSRPRDSMIPADSWSQEHIAARYSGQLFADLLLLYNAPQDDAAALAQAIQWAGCENAHILGLHVSDEDAPSAPSEDEWVNPFFAACRGAALQGHVARDEGDWLEALLRRAPYVDAIILDAGNLETNGRLSELLRRSPRPLLFVPGKQRPTRRLLLYYDDSPRAREALFASAYMAEEWGAGLIVQFAVTNDEQEARVKAYLDLHELNAPFVTTGLDWPALPQVARQHDCDLIVMGAPQADAQRNLDPEALARLVRGVDRPLFICT